jgi:S-adenosylmethionine-dependent methyltransferase
MTVQEPPARDFAITAAQKVELRAALLDTFFRGWHAGHLASPAGEKDIETITHLRYDWCIKRVVPWISRHLPLEGRTVVEVGCGAGSSTSAIAHFAASVDGYDIDSNAVEGARRRAAILGQDNVRVHLIKPGELIPAMRAQHPNGADVVLLYAVLEHQTIPERLETIRACWDLLAPGGLMVVVDTPNRLIYFDGHTALLPFFSMLPAELAIHYAAFSPREMLVQSIGDALKQSESTALNSMTRWGLGVSYHEFQVALGDLTDLVVGDGYDPEIFSDRPVSLAERCLYTYWKHPGVNAPVGFARELLDLIFRKPDSAPAPPRCERILPIDVLLEAPQSPAVRKWWQLGR